MQPGQQDDAGRELVSKLDAIIEWLDSPQPPSGWTAERARAYAVSFQDFRQRILDGTATGQDMTLSWGRALDFEGLNHGEVVDLARAVDRSRLRYFTNEVALIPPRQAPANVISGLDEVDAWSLWIPVPLTLSAADVGCLLAPGLQLALWRFRSGAARSPGGAFGVGARIVDSLVSTVTLDVEGKGVFFGKVATVYSDIAIAARDADALAEFWSPDGASGNSAGALFARWPRRACLGTAL
jgi:hypothetical protein